MAKRKHDENKFDPENLTKSIIAKPLLDEIERDPEKVHPIIIDVNLDYVGGRKKAKDQLVIELQQFIKKSRAKSSYVNVEATEENQQYVFAGLTGSLIQKLMKQDFVENSDSKQRLIYKIWPDFPVSALINSSIKTVKADAARRSFSAFGEGIVWAVMDSGVDKDHLHFSQTGATPFHNLDTGFDKDFTISPDHPGNPFRDDFGHGTHVAGIIAGEALNVSVVTKFRDEHNEVSYRTQKIDAIAGIASKCKIVSFKVLDENGNGSTSQIIRALNYIQELNSYGRDLKIHGVNLSLGNRFEPEWFACGQSPLCVEVNRLVKSGVVVVVAAGNSGYGYLRNAKDESFMAGLALSIFDPGNAELAITVGSTHRDSPHVYGVSYFSSKGPTGDGRVKPDLVAPGERIISCASGMKKIRLQNDQSNNITEGFDYCEDSGTSMAAPHVSGVIASFLSVRKEFIGQPEKLKEIFMNTATDLRRDRYFQGAGLIDLMRALQAV